MSLKKVSNWERSSGEGADRFRCLVKDVNGRLHTVRLSRTRTGARKATYGWRLLVKGFGNLSIGYWGDSESTAKRHAADTLKRMTVKREARRLVVSKCHAHGTLMVSVQDDDGGTRLTPDECCGLWSEVRGWDIDDVMVKRLEKEFST